MIKLQYKLLILLFLLNACGVEQKREARSLFDSKAYFEQEIERLNKQKVSIEKQVRMDEDTQRIELDTVDWEAELALFLRSNINKPALVDEYETDSLIEEGKLRAVHYQTQKEGLKTRKLSLYFRDDSIRRIEIFNKTKNTVYGAEQHLRYEPAVGYEMRDTQQVQLVGTNLFSVKVAFLP